MPYPVTSTHRLWLFGFALAIALALAVPAALAAPPANDGFSAAQQITGESGEVAATSKDATKEASEPAHAGEAGGASIWFRWTAERDGTLTVWTTAQTFDTVLGVYSGGSVGTLTELASNDDHGASTASRVTFPAVAGEEYRIAVDGVGGTNGPFRLRWRQGPENDNFADANVIAGSSGSVEGSSFGATAEPGEVTDMSTASSWYRWSAPESGTFGFVVRDAQSVSVYTGSTIGGLTGAGETAEDGTLSFAAVAGVEYSVRVAGYNWNQTYPFTLLWGKAPVNDAFSAAVELDGSGGSMDGSTAFATLEAGESAKGHHSVWYTWTAPTTGHVRFDAWRLRDATWTWIDTILTVYSGESVDALESVATNDDSYDTGLPRDGSALSFHAVAGTTYSIAVESRYSWGLFRLRWYPGAIIRAGSGDNTIAGTPGRDFLYGGSGDDVIHGRGGNDLVVGGRGRDRLYGDNGADSLISRDFTRGNDMIFGGPGTDTAVRDRGDGLHGVP